MILSTSGTWGRFPVKKAVGLAGWADGVKRPGWKVWTARASGTPNAGMPLMCAARRAEASEARGKGTLQDGWNIIGIGALGLATWAGYVVEQIQWVSIIPKKRVK